MRGGGRSKRVRAESASSWLGAPAERQRMRSLERPMQQHVKLLRRPAAACCAAAWQVPFPASVRLPCCHQLTLLCCC